MITIRQPKTDEAIELKIAENFKIVDNYVKLMIAGQIPSLIVSGPPGLGKSYSIEKALHDWDAYGDKHTIMKGFVGLTGLYKALYDHRQKGKIIVFDDADSIFGDIDALNLLKAACDSSDVRRINYGKETVMVSNKDGRPVETDFIFNGSVIFITNEDFDAKIAANHRLAPHFKALTSRAFYIDLGMKTQQDYMVRINQVVRLGMLRKKGLTETQENAVLSFIIEYKDRLRELSLRMVGMVGMLVKQNDPLWQQMAIATLCKKE